MHVIKIAKINRSESIDFDALPQKSKDFVVNYGLKQLLNDSIVSGESDEERNGLLDKKLDKLLEGTLDIRESTRETDPLAKEITRLAEDQTAKHFAKQGVKKSKVASADWTIVVNKYRAHPAIIAKATELAAMKADVEVEL